jgi:hypothetical protein
VIFDHVLCEGRDSGLRGLFAVELALGHLGHAFAISFHGEDLVAEGYRRFLGVGSGRQYGNECEREAADHDGFLGGHLAEKNGKRTAWPSSKACAVYSDA